jgi:predicted AlkP superfamily pyrophosphatase or phosphodiesterase
LASALKEKITMSFSRTLVLCLSLHLAAGAQAGDIERVLVVSIDALHPAALTAEAAPTLHALMQPGRYALDGRSVDPPKTLIAHTAMLTGLTPEESGKRDNDWKPGQPQVARPTLLDDAKQQGFATAFYYAKTKLGYLVSAGVDEHALAPDDGIDRARAFLAQDGKRFVFLHISGLEYAGSNAGWLSADYLDALTYIDMALSPLLQDVMRGGEYYLMVTSDHAGHERLHGTQHPEDYRLPLIQAGAPAPPALPAGTFPITRIRGTVQQALITGPGR